MNVKKIRSRKALKFLGLLISAMVIASVSAQVYNYMYIQGSGVASTAKGLKWETGTDLPSPGPTIVGYTVTNLNFSTGAGPTNYTDCLRIVNQDPAENHTFNLRVKKSWGNWTEYSEFNLVVFDGPPNSTGVQQEVLDLSNSTALTTDMIILSSETWYVLFEIVPIANPTGTKVYFEIELMYESAA